MIVSFVPRLATPRPRADLASPRACQTRALRVGRALRSKWRYTDRTLHSGFYIGLALGLITVAAVVVLVARILIYASRIGKQAQTAAEALAVVQKSTNILPAGKQVNQHASAILEAAKTARGALSA